STVDQSAITGEAVPVTVTAGEESEVFAGTINIDGTLEIEVGREPEDFTISQIARLVEQAQSQRSPAERFVDRFAEWYTPLVVALLIIACPCALIVSIPVTVVSALTRLAHLGVLVRGGANLDELARTTVFAFDKTGTLTRGRPTVSGVRSFECAHTEAHLTEC